MKLKVFAIVAIGVLSAQSSAVLAQSSFMADVIGQAVANSGSGLPRACLALTQPENPVAVARFAAEAEPALRAYLALAATAADPSPSYKRRLADPWALDGVAAKDLRTISDPWAGKVARLEQVGLILGRYELFGHGVWRAYDASDTLLGVYDAELIRKSKGYAVTRLALWSPGSADKAKPLNPYCAEPGDHEDWVKAEAEREARKAKRRAERAAREAQ